MRKTVIITAIIVGISIIVLFAFINQNSRGEQAGINYAEVKTGNLEIVVSGTGELIAEKSVDIMGPNITQYRSIRIAGLKITDIIPEGTRVRKGDYIATLDKSVFENNLKDELTALDTLKTSLEMKIIDTAMTLSTMRDDIRNQRFVADEARITVKQSKFEPAGTIRLVELEKDRAERALVQLEQLYRLKQLQAFSDIKSIKTYLNIQQRKVNELEKILPEFVITAPADGIVVFKADRQGVKIKSGATLNAFSPIVAALPDLTNMISKLYVSELEVNNVQKGMTVQVTVDALKGKLFTGKVISVANIGEGLVNSDSKMFEVLVKIEEKDPFLMPSMTTNNKLIVKTFSNVTYVPLESVNTGTDSIPFVYTRNEIKQIVLLGESNNKYIIIDQGLKPGTEVWLRIPDNPGKYKLAGMDLIETIKKRDRLSIALLKEPESPISLPD